MALGLCWTLAAATGAGSGLGRGPAVAGRAALPQAERRLTTLVPPARLVRTVVDLVGSGRAGQVEELPG